MQFEGRRRSSRMFDMTPLIDAVFLLLVFFMLTSHFVKEGRIAIDLPAAASADPQTEEELLTVVLDARGNLLFQDHIVDPDRLAAILRQAIGERTDATVRLRGDRAAALGAAVSVLDAAREAGAAGVDIVTEPR